MGGRGEALDRDAPGRMVLSLAPGDGGARGACVPGQGSSWKLEERGCSHRRTGGQREGEEGWKAVGSQGGRGAGGGRKGEHRGAVGGAWCAVGMGEGGSLGFICWDQLGSSLGCLCVSPCARSCTRHCECHCTSAAGPALSYPPAGSLLKAQPLPLLGRCPAGDPPPGSPAPVGAHWDSERPAVHRASSHPPPGELSEGSGLRWLLSLTLNTAPLGGGAREEGAGPGSPKAMAPQDSVLASWAASTQPVGPNLQQKCLVIDF